MIRAVRPRRQGLRERLLSAGVRPTRQRLRVLEELAREPHDATAQQLFQRLRTAGEPIGLATVYRTLGTLAQQGILDAMTHIPGEACYRLCSEAHHHHVVCSGCHRVVELEGCGAGGWIEAAAAQVGFRATSHHVEIVGVCEDCRAA
jgi:Fur family ferric uptake transcriptional regulator